MKYSTKCPKSPAIEAQHENLSLSAFSLPFSLTPIPLSVSQPHHQRERERETPSTASSPTMEPPPVPERASIPSGDGTVWADVSPLLAAACGGRFCFALLFHFLDSFLLSEVWCVFGWRENWKRNGWFLDFEFWWF